MAVKMRYTKMAYTDPDDMVFGEAPNAIKNYGLGLELGAGYVVPEVNYGPRPGSEASKMKMVNEYRHITKDILERAVTIGLPTIELETEHVFQMTNDPSWGEAVTKKQFELMKKFNEEYGIKLGLRHTPGDLRRDELAPAGLREDAEHDYPNKIMATVEACAKAGASNISCETVGGKEILDYAVARQDLKGILFGIGCLGSIDMEWVWSQIVDTVNKAGTSCIPGGETNCSGANTCMFVAGGLLDNNLPHVYAIIARAIAAGRTLVCYECGGKGPGKDCGYEGPIVKAVAGIPHAQEGKDATCAHADIMGNLIAQCCDLWSNESVEYHSEFGGSTVQVWAQALGYEVALMNAAKQTGKDKVLRDLYVAADLYRDPQPYVLAYFNAFKVGQAIVANGNDIYLRAKAAGEVAAKLVDEANKKGELKLTKFERKALDKALEELASFPDSMDAFMDECMKEYAEKVEVFNPKNYGL